VHHKGALLKLAYLGSNSDGLQDERERRATLFQLRRVHDEARECHRVGLCAFSAWQAPQNSALGGHQEHIHTLRTLWSRKCAERTPSVVTIVAFAWAAMTLVGHNGKASKAKIVSH
jgi:hypothetical protein